MAVSDDHIFHLASGTELSVEAARGDLARVRRMLCTEDAVTAGLEVDGAISDIDHVVELIHMLQAGYNASERLPYAEEVRQQSLNEIAFHVLGHAFPDKTRDEMTLDDISDLRYTIKYADTDLAVIMPLCVEQA